MNLNMKKTVIVSITILLIAVAFAGCTAAQPQSDASAGSFTKTASLPIKHFNPDGTCYYTTTVDVRNTDSAAAKNVMVRCSLKDSGTGNIADTKSQFFEVIDAGDHKAFTVNLDGECNIAYEISVDVTKDYK